MTMAAYGAHLERTQTWWDHGAKEFFAYMSRAQHLLQAGTFAGDVLLCVPGEAPEYGTDGEIPEGYDGDRCHPDVLPSVKVVEDGAVEVPGGTKYRVVGIPESPSAAIAAQAARLTAAGATVVQYDKVGAALRRLGCAPDFSCDDRDVTWIHRRADDGEFYFVAVPNKEPKRIVCTFRAGGITPELWDPVTGDVRILDERFFRITQDGRTEVSLDCAPSHSVFVVFRAAKTGSVPTQDSGSAGAVPVDGTWEVGFREPGAERDIATAKYSVLESWTKSENPDIRYFSGTATYFVKFSMPANGVCPQNRRVVLDLGEVKEIAEVTVNGRVYPALWKPPYQVDITDAVAGNCGAGDSIDLEVKVTNLWPNRLIGDAALGEDCDRDDGKNSKGYPLVKAWPEWLRRGEISPTGRHAFSTCSLWKSDEPLIESGLLGPVRIVLQ
jgi:hypothetical protein